MVTNTGIYEQIVKRTEVYLGPASERFVERQVRTHLNKEPEKLTSSDVKKLANWLKLAMALLTEDPKLLDEYTKTLSKLSGNNHYGRNTR